jgi:hypothetical protein
VEQAIALLVIIPFQPKLWEFVAALGAKIEDAFWKRTWVHAANLTEEQVLFVVSKLRLCRRPFSVLDFVDGARHSGMKFSEDFLLGVLEGALIEVETPEEKPGDIQMLQHHLTEVFQFLQQSPQTDEARLARLEWACLKLLDGYRHSPVALHRVLSRDPKFFAEVISHRYRPKSECGQPRDEVDESPKRLAEGAYGLLKSWRRLPGASADGTNDKLVLLDWLTQARGECAKLDRQGVADLQIGEVLSNAPTDPDGTWPCVAVRDAMEDINSEEIFCGFAAGVFKQRGSYSKSLTEGGAQERALANKYQTHAESIRAGWPMTASVLQRIADDYKSRGRFEDERLHER